MQMQTKNKSRDKYRMAIPKQSSQTTTKASAMDTQRTRPAGNAQNMDGTLTNTQYSNQMDPMDKRGNDNPWPDVGVNSLPSAALSTHEQDMERIFATERLMDTVPIKECDHGELSENVYKSGVCCSHMSYGLGLHLRPARSCSPICMYSRSSDHSLSCPLSPLRFLA